MELETSHGGHPSVGPCPPLPHPCRLDKHQAGGDHFCPSSHCGKAPSCSTLKCESSCPKCQHICHPPNRMTKTSDEESKIPQENI